MYSCKKRASHTKRGAILGFTLLYCLIGAMIVLGLFNMSLAGYVGASTGHRRAQAREYAEAGIALVRWNLASGRAPLEAIEEFGFEKDGFILEANPMEEGRVEVISTGRMTRPNGEVVTVRLRAVLEEGSGRVLGWEG